MVTESTAPGDEEEEEDDEEIAGWLSAFTSRFRKSSDLVWGFECAAMSERLPQSCLKCFVGCTCLTGSTSPPLSKVWFHRTSDSRPSRLPPSFLGQARGSLTKGDGLGIHSLVLEPRVCLPVHGETYTHPNATRMTSHHQAGRRTWTTGRHRLRAVRLRCLRDAV